MYSQIKKLEALCQQALLIRTGKSFTLTHAGMQLYQQSQSILASLSTLEHTFKNDPEKEGSIKIISPGSLGLKLYPSLLSVQEKHPKLTIDYRFSSNSAIEHALVNHTVDIGLMTRQPQKQGISAHPAGQETLYLVTPSKLKTITWKSLILLGFINHPDGEHHTNLLLGENYKEFVHYTQFPLKGFSNQISLILDPVSRGLGFTVLPGYAIEYFKQQTLITTYALNKPVNEVVYLRHQQHLLPNRVKYIKNKMLS